jgi:predicted NUDIX family NTP pyrophosphohydrolase
MERRPLKSARRLALSAGILMYRRIGARLEVLLVHPGGPYWRRKDDGAWSIPKGEIDADEDAVAAARREFTEETGHELSDAPMTELGQIRQRGGKVVMAWAVEGDLDPDTTVSNTFELEWPPRSGRVQAFPEIDRVAWFGLDEARRMIMAAQAPFLDRLEASLAVR